MKTRCAMCIATLLCVTWTSLSVEIENFTNNTSRFFDLAVSHDTIWAATADGLVHYAPDGEQIKKFTAADGLLHTHVSCVTKSNDGTIWVGYGDDKYGDDKEGVSHYDGAQWTHYTRDDSGLADYRNSLEVYSIAEDAHGAIWCGTNEWSLRFKDGVWTHYDSLDDVRTMAQDSSGVMWFGTEGGGVVSCRDSIMTGYNVSHGLANDAVTCIAVDTGGAIWCGTGVGISRFDGTAWRSYYSTSTNLCNDHIYALAIRDDNTVWAATDSGLCSFDGSTWQTMQGAEGITDGTVKDMVIDSRGHTWLASSRSGLHRFDGSVWETHASPSGLVCNYINDIAVDRQGNTWVATSHGIGLYNDTGWTSFTTGNCNLADDLVLTICCAPDGSVWFGTDGGATHYNGSVWTTYSKDNSGLYENHVKGIAVDSSGDRWFGAGSHNTSLSRYDGMTWQTYLVGHCINYVCDPPLHSVILSIAIAPDNAVWVGTDYEDGIGVLQDGSWTVYTPDNSGLFSDVVYSIGFDGADNVWIVSHRGLSNYTGDMWYSYTENNSDMVCQPLSDMAIDRQGDVWVVGDGGVSRFNTGTRTWDSYTEEDGLNSDDLTAVAAGPDNTIWIGTYQNGVSRITTSTRTRSHQRTGSSRGAQGIVVHTRGHGVTVEYTLATPAQVRMAVYTLQGRCVARHSGVEPAGVHTRVLEGFDKSSGTYIVRVRAGRMQACKRVMLVK